MSEHAGILIELILVFGGTLAFGAWQLWELKKLRLEREAKEREAQANGVQNDASAPVRNQG
jgi:hypothetical protein